jgi:hypothetical protein
MPVASETEPLQLFVGDADGEGVEGLLEEDFDIPAILDDATVVLSIADFVEIGGGYYVLMVTMPSTTGRLRIDPAMVDPADGTCDPEVYEGDVTAYSIDDVAVIAARPPSITLASNVGKNAAFTLEVYQYSAKTFRIPIYDEDGALRDLSGFNSFRFSIQNDDQTAVIGELPYDLTDAGGAIRGGVDGYLEVDLPEDCSAYAQLATGDSRVVLNWSADGDPNDDTLTETLRGGRFIIKRKETPTP